MAKSPEERERAIAAQEAEAKRLLADARAAHRAADRARTRARHLAGRFARKLQYTLVTTRDQLDADRAALDARLAGFNEVQSEFHTSTAAERDQLRAAWAELAARQKRSAEEWAEGNRFQAEQAAVLDARAAELAAREKAETNTRTRLQREVTALREEAAALDARVRNARQLVDELERRRTELRAGALAPAAPGAEPPPELLVALDRAADRDLEKWAAELTEREERLTRERAAVQALAADVSADRATLADRRRVLAEQFAQLAAARARWQEAERATVAEMEELARTLRRREAELDAHAGRLVRADARRREDAFELWQLRLRLEAWQSKIVAYELRWYTERERTGAAPDPNAPDAIPLALPVTDGDAPAAAELAVLRAELERLAAVMLEAELPEPPDVPESELPWGTEDVPMATAEPDGTDVLRFDSSARAA